MPAHESTERFLVRTQGSLRRYHRSAEPELSIVCFPWAGGGASVYRRFAVQFPDWVELLSVQLPAREDQLRETKLEQMHAIVDHVLRDIARIEGPLVLFGHSLGALIAYEVAHALRTELQREPEMLIVSASRAPHLPEQPGRCSSSSSDAELLDNIRALGGTPAEVLESPDMIRTLLPALRADYAVLDNYRASARTPLSCSLVACTGDRDPRCSPETIEAWRTQTSGSFRRYTFAGGHFYLCEEPVETARFLLRVIAPVRFGAR